MRSLRRSLAVAVCAAASLLGLLLVSPTTADADPTWAPAETATIHPGADGHLGWPVHGQLRVLHRHRRLPRPGGPLLEHRPDRHRRLLGGLPAARHPGRDRGRQPTRDPGLQLVAHHAGRQGSATPTPAPSTTWPWCASTPPTSARSTPPCRSGAGRTRSTPTGRPRASGSTPTATPASRFGISQLSPKTGTSLGSGGGWSHDVYTLSPGIPGDSGRRLPVLEWPGPGRALDPADRPAGGQQRGRRPGPRAGLRPSPRPRPGRAPARAGDRGLQRQPHPGLG